MIGRNFRVLARGPMPSEGALRLARQMGASLDYQEIVVDGADVELQHDSGIDIRIWSPAGVVEMNKAHDVRSRLGSGLAVGDADGLCLIERADGIFVVGWGAMDPAELQFVAVDLRSMLGGDLGGLPSA